jgi:uncharacterized protein involved in type VI secretion and phage assembly
MALNDLSESRRFDFSLSNQGSPAFGVVQLEGTEAISQLYRFDLMLVSESADVDFDAVLVGADPILTTGQFSIGVNTKSSKTDANTIFRGKAEQREL